MLEARTGDNDQKEVSWLSECAVLRHQTSHAHQSPTVCGCGCVRVRSGCVRALTRSRLCDNQYYHLTATTHDQHAATQLPSRLPQVELGLTTNGAGGDNNDEEGGVMEHVGEHIPELPLNQRVKLT